MYFLVSWDITGCTFDGPYMDAESTRDIARERLVEGEIENAVVIGPLEALTVELDD